MGPLGSHPLRQSAPGRYEVRFALHEFGSFVLSATHRLDDRTVASSDATLENPYPIEYQAVAPNEALLREAAALTGGGRLSSAASAFDNLGDHIEAHEALWPYPVAAALLLFMFDLLLRRVRLFDRNFRQPGSSKQLREPAKL